MKTKEKELLRGGQFLVKETKCEDVFTPEDFSEEQVMMRDAVIEFNDREVIPYKDRFEAKAELSGYEFRSLALVRCRQNEHLPKIAIITTLTP